MFDDRKEAGVLLAERLKGYKGRVDALVLALPRGGVSTGLEIARILGVPLDVLIVRKIGFPGQPEFAIGAVSETGAVVLNEQVISSYEVSPAYIEREVSKQKEEISRRIKLYRGGKGIGRLEGKTVILVDDGVATGATVKAAIETLRHEKLKELVVAIPVSPPSTAKELEGMSDRLVCLETPWDFQAVGAHYRDFTQVEDEEVVEMLKGQAAKDTEADVEIEIGPVTLYGTLHLPKGARGIVVFAHGSGSSRLSPRNRFVAEMLHEAGIGTLLFDLLTEKEDLIYENRFDIELLTERLKAVTLWLKDRPDAKGLDIGYFGASTGAPAALGAAAALPSGTIKAVVSRGGRPDLASKALPHVSTPTLLIVGGLDDIVIELNREAFTLIKTKDKELKIVPGASHLFEEPGKLEEMARLAVKWFKKYIEGE